MYESYGMYNMYNICSMYNIYSMYNMYRSYGRVCTDSKVCTYVGTYVRRYLVTELPNIPEILSNIVMFQPKRTLLKKHMLCFNTQKASSKPGQP